jgi:hypothetical protein
MAILKKDLQSLIKDIKGLGKAIDKLIKELDKDKNTKRLKKVIKKTVSIKIPEKVQLENESVKKKGSGPTATNQVLKIINKSKMGVNTPALINKTGFNEKKIRNILYRAFREGKIKRVARGFYVGVESREWSESDYYKNIDRYIIELGSLEAVYEYYPGDAFCNIYAREKAPALLNISKAGVIELLTKLEAQANEIQKQRITELLKEKQLDTADIAEKVGVEQQTVCAFKDHSKLIKGGIESGSKKRKGASKNIHQEASFKKGKNIISSLSDWISCPKCGVDLKRKNLSKHNKKVHDKLKKITTSNSSKLKVPISPKPYYSTKKFPWRPLNWTTIEGSCPGCGAIETCYCG